jgi:hypothetical protein
MSALHLHKLHRAAYGLCMVAQPEAVLVASSARTRWLLDFEVIDRRLIELGVDLDDKAAEAAALGLDQSTVWRLRQRKTVPLVASVMTISESLGIMPHLLLVKES